MDHKNTKTIREHYFKKNNKEKLKDLPKIERELNKHRSEFKTQLNTQPKNINEI